MTTPIVARTDEDSYSDTDHETFCVADASEWTSANSDDLLDLWEEVSETLESRFALRGAPFASFASLCHSIYSDDLQYPYASRLAEIPRDLRDLGIESKDVEASIRRRLDFKRFCFRHNDVIRGTYDAVVPDLLDPAREFTYGYIERYARFLYNHTIQ